MKRRAVAVLGSTGSIGTQTLDVVRANESAFNVASLAVQTSVSSLVEQAVEFTPDAVGVAGEAEAAEARQRLDAEVAAGRLARTPEVLVGPAGLAQLARAADVVVNAVVGFAGLDVTLATLGAGRRLALANKESLIAAGPLCAQLRRTPGAELVPVDSEHSALHQCLGASVSASEGSPSSDGSQNRSDRHTQLAKLVLTASGGPFRGKSADELADVSLADALAHPTWQMGPKVTVDSSTLMNKGLEIIEAHELFGVDYSSIDVVVHPQSIVHSMATFTDGSTIAQLSLPDMRLPISYALSYPARAAEPFGAIDWAEVGALTFEPPDRKTFRSLDVAYAAGAAGNTAPAWMNGANEAAVAAFIDGRIGWADIVGCVDAAMDRYDGAGCDSVEAVVRADAAGRRAVAERIS